jgi:DNA mismatch repair protein MutL
VNPAGDRAQSGVMAEPQWAYSGPEAKTESGAVQPFRQEILVEEIPQVIGQLKETYILCQTGDGLLVVDQHAAHERIVYEDLKKSYRNAHIESQSFLIPHKMELSQKEGRLVLKHLGRLAQMGLDLEHFGGNTFLLRSVPSIMVSANWDAFLRELIPFLEQEGTDLTNEKALDGLLTLMACHGAIRAGKRLSQDEMKRLLKQLQEVDLSTNCPHGRPVSNSFSFREFEKMFKRVI